MTHDDPTAKTPNGQIDANGHFHREPRKSGLTPFKVLFPIGMIVFVAFWTWALFFASKTAVNKIEDEAWKTRTEAICEPVKAELKRIETLADASLEVRADLVVQSTDLLSQMLDDIDAVAPTDAKGQAIVPAWIGDWRQLVQDRYNYADRLRDGDNVPFTETAINGVPITERIETFAGDNDIPSCAPPHGSVV